MVLRNRATRGRRHGRMIPTEDPAPGTQQSTAAVRGFNLTSAISHYGEDTKEPDRAILVHEEICTGNPFDIYQAWDSFIPDPDQVSSETSQESTRSRNSSTDHDCFHLPPASVVVTYSYFHFLTISNLHIIPSSDVNYLESQGCLHVPMRPMLDDFVEQYFLHVHPMVPIIDEGDFWDMYAQNKMDRDGGSTDTISLVLFQAMLFSSCTFVPFDNIRKLGFVSLRQARGEFYRRAKLLYDLDTETNHLPLAQAALLLMLWYPPLNVTLIPCQTWLSRALQHARSLDADGLATRVEVSTKGQGILRRLWWCCIIADRVSTLCTRYHPSINYFTFDFESSIALKASDLQGEVYRSCVYNPVSKKSLICVFEVSINFMVILTDVLEITFPFKNLSTARESPKQDESTRIRECEGAMDRWFNHATTTVPPFEEPDSVLETKGSLHKSVDLHIGLLYIYY
ncbi:hypothetical protein QSH57_005057 [Fusarium oxysporum f. sp. vasinfectum]|nr:hypothetical protein QSH57_005057 [Fusarium oxysporum f. sp. vasinfectum]